MIDFDRITPDERRGYRSNPLSVRPAEYNEIEFIQPEPDYSQVDVFLKKIDRLNDEIPAIQDEIARRKAIAETKKDLYALQVELEMQNITDSEFQQAQRHNDLVDKQIKNIPELESQIKLKTAAISRLTDEAAKAKQAADEAALVIIAEKLQTQLEKFSDKLRESLPDFEKILSLSNALRKLPQFRHGAELDTELPYSPLNAYMVYLQQSSARFIQSVKQ
jgi:uncharacterized small protein (DUF1192 family)